MGNCTPTSESLTSYIFVRVNVRGCIKTGKTKDQTFQKKKKTAHEAAVRSVVPHSDRANISGIALWCQHNHNTRELWLFITILPKPKCRNPKFHCGWRWERIVENDWPTKNIVQKPSSYLNFDLRVSLLHSTEKLQDKIMAQSQDTLNMDPKTPYLIGLASDDVTKHSSVW